MTVENILTMTNDEFNAKLLKNILGRTSDEDECGPPEQCENCLNCSDCKLMKEYGSSSVSAYEEQKIIEDMIYFVEKGDGTGQFYSPLPFGEDPDNLVGNRIQAEKYLNNLIKSIKKSPEDSDKVKEAFTNLIDKNFIQKADSLPDTEEPGGRQDVMDNTKAHFIPNTIAWKENSKSTACRICFDGSRKCNKGQKSFNEMLLKGVSVYSMKRTMIKWRLLSYGLSTDISKFYARIGLAPEHRKFMNILWKTSLEEEEKAEWFTLIVHIFDIQSTAGVSKAVMKKIAEAADELGLPEVASAVNEAYVDDINTSTRTEEQVQKLREDLKNHMTSKGMPLKGFAVTGEKPDEGLTDENYTLVGGYKWFSETDEMQLMVPRIFKGAKKKGKYKKGSEVLRADPSIEEIREFYANYGVTLEHLVSRIAAHYDPIGGSAPVAVYGNQIVREAFIEVKAKKKVKVSEQLKTKFLVYLEMLQQYGKMTFLRNPGRADYEKKGCLLAFYDSSQEAWMTVFYILREDKAGVYFTEFLYASGGLCKAIGTIPKFELNAGWTAAEIVASILDLIEPEIKGKFLLGDSKISLYWIKNANLKVPRYVKRRTRRIRQVFAENEILYVKSCDNPADFGTRHSKIQNNLKELNQEGGFRNGPKFLEKGIEKAIEDGDLQNMKSVKMTKEDELDEVIEENNDELFPSWPENNIRLVIRKLERMCG